MAATPAPLTLADRLAAWRYAFRTTNPPEQGVVDGITRWLVVTRAGVLPMTLTSGLIAVLLAAAADVRVDWLAVTLAVVGSSSHLANNLANDLADTGWASAADYRALALHPSSPAWSARRRLIAASIARPRSDHGDARRPGDWWIVPRPRWPPPL
jgi:1,4-dihydroxy-2-naphthoate octaprenyltransferase